MVRYRPLVCALVLLAATASQAVPRAALASPAAPRVAALKGIAAAMDTWLRSLTAKGQFQGTVLVARKGTILLKKGYGLADAQSGTPNRASTRFSIGSITKQFTAMAILQLKEQGKLSTQDLLCEYVDGCPSAWRPITLQMLLTHTSGIPDFPNRSTDLSKPMTADRLLTLLESEPLDFPPGSRWSYSNSGYDLLGMVVERVSGQPWATFVQRNILDPLRMTHSGVEEAAAAVPDHATGYRTILGRTPLPADAMDPSLALSSGSLYSTVGDLYLWDRALSEGTLFSKTALAAMFTPYVPIADASSTRYGYGWFLDDSVPAHRLMFHGGSVPGFESVNVLAPTDGVTVIVMSNDGTADATDIGLVLTAEAIGPGSGFQAP